ncbi:BrnT family toxin [Bartonella sp. DGB2]|uniref:BrnT family toxin n=1 Tax=Bartonella sp. DGB2 TaxID=3388426 RepID=UPI00398FC479
MNFEWDATKATVNLRKHGVAFEDAIRVFLDSGRIEAFDERNDYGEDRWITIGQVYTAILYVVYTVRHEDTMRIISARKALSHEQKRYYEANT